MAKDKTLAVNTENIGVDYLLKKHSDIIAYASTPRPHQFISMGPLSVNLLLGNPLGIEAGRLVQITGKPSHGKTTLAYDMCAQYLTAHPTEYAMFLDFERTFDMAYAAACGVPVDRLLVVRANYAEEGIHILEEALRKDAVRFAVFDSVPAAMPKDELEKDFTDRPKMASSATVVTRFCQRVTGLLENKNAIVVLVNQMRKNFSTLSREEELPFGGVALQYFSSLIINVYRVKREEDRIHVQATIAKSKVSRPQGKVEFHIVFGRGIDHAVDILTLAEERDIIRKSGAWFAYKDHKAQGLENAALTFPIDEIRLAVLEHEEVI